MLPAEVLYRKLTIAPSEDVGVARIEDDRAAVAVSVLRELEALAKTNKWRLLGSISKEAAWGRAYGEAMKELFAKYSQGVKTDGR